MKGQSNPLLERLVRRGKWPSMRAALWLAFGLGLVSLTITTQATLRLQDTAPSPLTLIMLLAGWPLTALAPIFVAVIAVVLTSRDTRGGLHELLRLTALSEAALVRGYVLSALHRARVILALVVGLMPAVVVGTLQFAILLHVIFYNIMSTSYPGEPYLGPPLSIDAPVMIQSSFEILAILLGLWGMNLLAAALGVALGLRWRTGVGPTVVAPLIVFLITLVLLALVVIPASGPGPALVALILLIPYALGAALMALARRWSRI